MISADTDKLQEISNNIKELANNLDSEKEKIIENINKLNEFWQGDDSIKYTRAIIEVYKPNIEQLVKTLLDYSDFLNEVREKYIELDEKYASRII